MLKMVSEMRSGWEVMTNDITEFEEDTSHSNDFFEMLRHESETNAGLHWFLEELYQRICRETVNYNSGRIVIIERSLEGLASLASVLSAIGRLTKRAERKIRKVELETCMKTLVPCWKVQYVHVDISMTENLKRIVQKARVNCKTGAVEMLLKYNAMIRRPLSPDGLINGNIGIQEMADDLISVIDYWLESSL